MQPADPTKGRLAGRLIGLGVTGSIAAYKAVELLRLLRAEGADVVAMLTPSATRFVGPLSFAALSRHPVETDQLDLLSDGRIGHIVLADAADLIVVAPATAHWLGAMANGLAADVVTATSLATSAPVVVAPAMDGDMWRHPATQANAERLRSFGYDVLEPEMGALASGQAGVGRLVEPGQIVDRIVTVLAGRPIRLPDPGARPPMAEPVREEDLAGRHLIVTAGGTREPIDPVRFIGNRSTGKMGVAVAAAAAERGARVTLIAANIEVPPPAGVTVVPVSSTGELRAALLRSTSPAGNGRAPFDGLVMAAAVADFRPAEPAERKLERGGRLTLELESTPDLLAEIGRIARGLDSEGAQTRTPLEPRPVLVGFAAETGGLDRAADKLRRKGVDLLVANDVTEPGSGFAADTNRVTILARGAEPEALPLLAKRDVADRILDRVARALDERDAAAQTGVQSTHTEPVREPTT